MSLTSDSRALLEMAYRIGAPRFHELSVDQARRSSQKLHFAFRPDAPAVAAVTEVQMGALPARHYRPLGQPEDARLPLTLFFHGGGFCVGDVASYDVFCRELANAANCAVLSVDYRLAPEHPFPAAVDDANFAFAWAVGHAAQLGIDPQRIALAGDSAGGNLALVAALTQRDQPAAAGGVQPCFLGLIYPCTEIHSQRPSRLDYAQGYFLDLETMDWFFERYLPQGGAEDWRASPMRASSLANLPPMWVLGAEYDPLVDDCRAFAERVRAEGGAVEYCEVAGVLHGFLTLGKRFPEAGRSVALFAQTLRAGFATRGVKPLLQTLV